MRRRPLASGRGLKRKSRLYQNETRFIMVEVPVSTAPAKKHNSFVPLLSLADYKPDQELAVKSLGDAEAKSDDDGMSRFTQPKFGR